MAFDLPDRESCEQFYLGLFDLGLLAIRSGERSIRFRPALDFPDKEIPAVVKILREQCQRTKRGGSQPRESRTEEMLNEAAG
jgi:L-lysine 6-transaminase